MDTVLFTVILLMGALLRFVFLGTRSSDDMVHLWNTQLRARHNNLTSHEPLDSVLKGKRGYPALSHYIVSRFPEKYWRLAGKLLNISYDLLLVVVTWVIAELALPAPREMVLSPSLVAMAVTATSPLMLPINSRIKSMGARTLGNVFVFAYVMSLWCALQLNVILGLLGMVILGLTIVITSKFALQFILFTAPFLSLFCASWLPLVGCAYVVLGIFVIPGFGLRDVVFFMVAHSRWYARNYYTVSSVASRNRLKDWWNLPHVFREQNGVFWNTVFRRSSYFIALYSFPVVFALPLIGPSLPVFNGDLSIVGFGTAIVCATVGVFWVTSLRPFLFLGQAERYLEYSLPYAAVLFALAYQMGALSLEAVLSVLGFQIAMSLANLAYSHYASIQSALNPPGCDPDLNFLASLEGKRILTLPVKLSFLLSFDSSASNRYYYRAINMPDDGFRYLEEDLAWFEMPRPDFAFFRKKYGIDTVVADKVFLPRAQKRGIHYPLDQYVVLAENARYIVVDISREVRSSS